MIKKLLLFMVPGLFALAVLTGCSRNELEFDPNTQVMINGQIHPSTQYMKGRVSIKVSDELVKELESITDENGTVIPTGVKSFANSFAQLGTIKMERIFPHAGKFEERTRAEGMHKWYYVYFDEELTLTKAGDELKSVEGVEIMEFNPIMARPQYKKVEEFEGDENLPATRQNDELPFDDPRLGNQWHYYNNGTRYYSEAGSDINVLPVWKAGITGNSNVIVSVVDGGIDYAHEDLADNMWRNPSQSGDKVYGYNFVSGENGYTIIPDEHGTHVAGTIGAVNNNGKGLCGIAGGNFAENVPGVRLMSCQIFNGDKGGDGARAIKWGADNGAVISNNSWGYIYDPQHPLYDTPQYDKDAIEYFIKYAGMDENNNQVGPMAGGVVIFAAGNDNVDVSYPGSYESVIAVSAIDAEYEKAYYSNYGPWVDIAATGGDSYDNNEIWSTTPGNKYAAFQGTSMACPHISGIAALIVSNLGGPGFTNTQLKELILNSYRNIDEYNPGFVGKIGAGLINTELAVMSGGGEAPEQIVDLEIETRSNNIDFTLTIPKDPDSGKPNKIRIYYSKTTINPENLSNTSYEDFSVGSLFVGDQMSNTISKLDFETPYYVAASALDHIGQESVLSEIKSATTGGNNNPVIYPNEDIVISISKASSESRNIELNIYDNDGHSLSYKIEPQINGVTLSLNPGEENISYLTFNASSMPEGENAGSLIITDEYGASTSIDFIVTVEGNEAPVLIKEFENIRFSSDKASAVSIPLAEYISDENMESIMISLTPSVRGVANATFSNGNIVVSPQGQGFVDIQVMATDAAGESLTTSFQVAVIPEGVSYSAYPNPVVDNLYIRSGNDTDANISIISVNGKEVYTGTHKIGTFNPAIIDMLNIPTGIYTLVIKSDNEEYKQNIVKQ